MVIVLANINTLPPCSPLPSFHANIINTLSHDYAKLGL